MDATALAVVGLGAVGIVALVGEARGGSPYNGVTPIHRITSPGAVQRTFKSGDLVEAAALAFDPSQDPDIPAGAAELRLVKVNPSTRSTLTLLDGASNDSVVITSIDYGAFTTQINIDVSAGTTTGKKYTVTFGDTVEVFDNVGGTNIWTAQFTDGVNAMTTVTISLDNATGVEGLWTRTESGLDSQITDEGPGDEAVQVVSSAAGDDSQTITIYGLDGSGDPQSEVLSLDGTNAVVGTATWSKVLGCILSAAATGTVTVASNPTTATTLITLTPATLTRGIYEIDNGAVQAGQVLQVTAVGSATATDVVVFGFAGQTPIGEKFTTSAIGTPVVGTTTGWTDVTVLVLGAADTEFDWTLQGTAFSLGIIGYPTVQDVVDRIDNVAGWDAAIVGLPGVSNGTLLISTLDEQTAVDATSLVGVTGDLAQGVQVLNTSGLITAAIASGGNAAPTNTASPLYLAGGTEGTTTFADWQAAFDLLRDEFLNTLVPLTSDAAVHAAAVTHAEYMAGVGRKERDLILGAPSDQTLSALQGLAQALNTRHARMPFQDVQRFNTDGQLETFPPYMFAAAIAGAQAGSPVGESLTAKYLKANAVTQNSSIVLQDDANTLVQSGLWFLEEDSGVGYRCVRNITTHLIDNNLAYIEASVNEAVNVSVYNIRRNLEDAVGRKGFQATINQAVSNVVNTLSQLVDDEILTSWRNLTITLTNDVLEVDVEIAPIIPINFIQTTVHLVSAEFAAAA